MTDTTSLDTASPQDEKPRRSGALSTMKVAELQGLAASMGITGTAKMRKGDLVTAIKDRQSGGSTPSRAPHRAAEDQGVAQAPTRSERAQRAERTSSPAADAQAAPTREAPTGRQDRARADGGQNDRATRTGEAPQRTSDERAERGEPNERGGQNDRGPGNRRERNRSGRDERGLDERRERSDHGNDRIEDDRDHGDRPAGDRGQDDRGDRNQNRGDRGQDDRGDRNQNRGDQGQDDRGQDDRNQNRSNQGNQGGYGSDDEDGRGGRRRNRNRNRNRDRDKRGRGGREYGNEDDHETPVTDEDVLVPVAGILDVLDNYAFVRTSGYLPGSGDVYVPLGVVKKNGLRKGDAVTGAVKAVNEEQQQNQRQKFNALVRLDTVNGMQPDEARKRVEFGKLTPLYPQQRLRLETEPHILTTRVIDLVAPIGKGQRGLIVAPAKAGKTMVMQAIANAITTNNPECHLMVVLVDERPEEVTDMQRAVKGEVISSTFDRPAEDHTTVAELAIERAKRLVEMGHDVVVLLDSITKLGRAYNLAAPASGRILSGGVDSAALYPPKKFFGAARNIENGGSLTILATALVETGSRMDEVIFEEFKGTGNMELKLDRGLANRRIFPAVDINNSGTRKEEILLSGEELKIMWKLRRVLAALDQQQGIELLIDRIKKTKSNIDFLMQVQQTSSMRLEDHDDA